MSIIPWKPFTEMDKVFDQSDDWLLPIFSRSELNRPAMDVYETDKEVVAEVNLPGFKPDQVEISVEDSILKVRGTIEEKNEESNKEYWRREIRKGSFERLIRLPTAIKEDAIEAVYEKGVLKITMPKAEQKPASKVQIKIKD